MEQIILDHIPPGTKDCRGLMSLAGKYPNFIFINPKVILSNDSRYRITSYGDDIRYEVIIGNYFVVVRFQTLHESPYRLSIFMNGVFVDEIGFHCDGMKRFQSHHQYLKRTLVKSEVKYWD